MSDAGKRIYIVEDQRLIAADLENTLKKLGYIVAGSSGTGEEALAGIFSTAPDLILMDIRLRGPMDGIKVAATVRKRCDIPVVYLTAYADEETVRRATLTSPFGYVVKPFNERELRAAIEVGIYKHETDRALIEERARREAAEEFRLLVESVKDYAIFRLDRTGRVVTWNVGAERILGYRAEEIVGKPVAVLYEPDDVRAGRPETALRMARAQGSIEDEAFRVRKDGSRFWASSVTSVVRDAEGSLLGFGKVIRDLSDRKREEDARRFLDRATIALTSSLEYGQTLDRAARAALPELAEWCLLQLPNEKHHVEQVAAAHINPHKEEVARALHASLWRRPDGGRAAPDVLRTSRAQRHGLPDAGAAARLLGTERADLVAELGARSCITVLVQFRGRPAGVLYLLRSDASPPYSEHDLSVAEELAYRVGLALDNAQLFRETQQAIRARDEFLQIASHELRTPLTPLQLQLDTLMQAFDRAGEENERFSRRLQSATRQTERLARLVETLLDVSRLTSGRFALELEDFDFAAMVRDVAERMGVEANRAGSEIRVDGPRSLPGTWDRLRLEQVVVNLLSNALKYGPGKPIELELRAAEDTVGLSVRDHGIGIDPSAVERIFGRFERAVSMRHFGGLGLGLFVAKQIVDAHGGSIVVHSVPNEGATFTVVLPRQSVRPGVTATEAGTRDGE